MEGLEDDDLGAGSVAILGPVGRWGGWGASWDHFGADHLQRDRFRVAGGRVLPLPSRFGKVALGLSLSLLSQRFTLSEALQSVSPSDLSSTAFSFGAGLRFQPHARLALGLSGEDLTRPNLGVIGVDRAEAVLRLGVSYEFPRVGPGPLLLTLGAHRADSALEAQGGAEWSHTASGFSLRGGYRRRQASAGLGFSRGPFTLDYAYVFSTGEAASLGGTGLPANHLFELMWGWGGRFTPEDPDGYAALMRKAAEDEKAGRWNEALWTYRRASGKPEADPQAKRGWERVLAAYNHERAEQYLTYGQEAELRGLITEARHNYEWALRLEPSSQTAKEALRRVQDSAPTGAMADSQVVRWLQEAADLSASGEKAQAATLLQRAQERHPDDPTLESFVKLLATAPVTQTSAPNDPAVTRLLAEAEIYQHKGRADLATDSWKRVLAVDPKNPEASEKLKAARSPRPTAQKVSASDRRQAQSLYELGLKAYLEGDVRSAIQDWEDALSHDPSHENALNNLARARLELSHGTSRPRLQPSPTPPNGENP
jgi:tetratricopeptide (TPR) repeat protein